MSLDTKTTLTYIAYYLNGNGGPKGLNPGPYNKFVETIGNYDFKQITSGELKSLKWIRSDDVDVSVKSIVNYLIKAARDNDQDLFDLRKDLLICAVRTKKLKEELVQEIKLKDNALNKISGKDDEIKQLNDELKRVKGTNITDNARVSQLETEKKELKTKHKKNLTSIQTDLKFVLDILKNDVTSEDEVDESELTPGPTSGSSVSKHISDEAERSFGGSRSNSRSSEMNRDSSKQLQTSVSKSASKSVSSSISKSTSNSRSNSMSASMSTSMSTPTSTSTSAPTSAPTSGTSTMTKREFLSRVSKLNQISDDRLKEREMMKLFEAGRESNLGIRQLVNQDDNKVFALEILDGVTDLESRRQIDHSRVYSIPYSRHIEDKQKVFLSDVKNKPRLRSLLVESVKKWKAR